MPRLCCLLALLALTACQSTDENQPGMAYDVSAGAESEEGATPAKGGGPAPLNQGPDDSAWLAPGHRPLKGWKDDTEGPVATLVYVTETRSRGKLTPAAMVFSSDPENAHFNRPRNTRSITVRRLYKREMARLLRELDRRGFGGLPWRAVSDYDADIGPERAFHLYRKQRRQRVIKESCAVREMMAFRKVEDRIIKLSMAR